MRKQVEIFKAILTGNISVDYINKTTIRRTPGNVTDVGHN
jgi:hypothetical protein